MNSDDNPSTAPPTEPQPPNASEAARPPDDWVVTTPVEGEVITSLATGNSLRDEFCNGRQRFLRTLRLEMFSDSALARLCGWFRLLAHLWILPEIILTASCPPPGPPPIPQLRPLAWCCVPCREDGDVHPGAYQRPTLRASWRDGLIITGVPAVEIKLLCVRRFSIR